MAVIICMDLLFYQGMLPQRQSCVPDVKTLKLAAEPGFNGNEAVPEFFHISE
jgi:hypothetical protein